MDFEEIKADIISNCAKEINENKPNVTKLNGDLKSQTKQTDLCNCPLHCSEKVTKEAREYLFHQFISLQRNSLQSKYLQKYIIIRSVAKRLWEDEIIDGKIQRRVTCKYQVPELTTIPENAFLNKNLQTENQENELSMSYAENGIQLNGGTHTKTTEQVKYNGNISSNGYYDDCCEMATDSSSSDSDNEDFMNGVLNPDCKKSMRGNIEICQKAFINIYGITEKRIRYLRERLIMKSRYLAEKKQKKIEEMERTLSIARNLGAGCQPLFALLEKTNSLHLSEQILAAIENDIILVNNFFRHQLWKPEDISAISKDASETNKDTQLSLLERLDSPNKLS